MRITLPRVALVGALAVGLSGAAVAAVPAPDGEIHGCYGKKGELRVTDAASPDKTMPACTADETALAWSQKGPQGPAGPAGPQGPKGATGATGAQGPAGPSFVRASYRNGSHEVTDEYQTFAFLTMPQGLHQVSGKASAYEYEVLGTDVWSMVTCRLVQHNPDGSDDVLDISQMDVGDNGPERLTMSLQGLANVTSPTATLRLQCKDDGSLAGGEFDFVYRMKLFAQEVGGWTLESID